MLIRHRSNAMPISWSRHVDCTDKAIDRCSSLSPIGEFRKWVDGLTVFDGRTLAEFRLSLDELNRAATIGTAFGYVTFQSVGRPVRFGLTRA